MPAQDAPKRDETFDLNSGLGRLRWSDTDETVPEALPGLARDAGRAGKKPSDGRDHPVGALGCRSLASSNSGPAAGSTGNYASTNTV